MSFPRSNLSQSDEPDKKRKRSELVQEKKEYSSRKPLSPDLLENYSLKINKVPNLNFHNYAVGHIVLGYILKIMDNQVIISLPGGVSGIVTKNEVTDMLHDNQTKGNPSNIHIKSILDAGKHVTCIIIRKDTENSRTLHLSMRGSLIHRGILFKHLQKGFPIRGYVESIEDYGYIINTGIADIKCFLQQKSSPSELVVGQILDCFVDNKNVDTRIVTLTTTNNIKKKKELITKNHKLSFHALVPGMLVHATVDHVLENGYAVKLLDSYHALLEKSHLPLSSINSPTTTTNTTSSDSQITTTTTPSSRPTFNMYSKGDTLLCRIIYIDPSSKLLRVSCKPHIMELRLPKDLPVLGSLVQDLQVTQIMKRSGIYCIVKPTATSTASEIQNISVDESSSNPMEIPHDTLVYYVNKTDLSTIHPVDNEESEEQEVDNETNKTQKKRRKTDLSTNTNSGSDGNKSITLASVDNLYDYFKIGDVIPAVRVLGYHLVDSILVATNHMQLLQDSAVVHSSQIEIGKLYNATITQINDAGILMKIQDKVKAFCPLQHVLEFTTKNMQLNKFKVRQIVKVKVWQIKSEHNIIVTMKKSLLDENTHNIYSYDDLYIGKIGCGVISYIDSNHGITLHFYNGIRAQLPLQFLLKQGVTELSDAYKSGQVIKCICLAKYHVKDVSHLSFTTSKQSNQDILIAALYLGDITTVISTLQEDVTRLAGVNAKNFLVTETEYTSRRTSKSSNGTATIVSSSNSDGNSHNNNNDMNIDNTEVSHTSTTKSNSSNGDFTTTTTTTTHMIVSGVISKIEEDQIRVSLDNGRHGIIPKYHLFDFHTTADTALLNKTIFTVGMRLSHILIFAQSKSTLYLSIKPLFLKSMKLSPYSYLNTSSSSSSISSSLQLQSSSTTTPTTTTTEEDLGHIPSQYKDFIPGQTVIGIILKVEDFGVLVQFMNFLIALIPRPNIIEKFVNSSIGLFHVGNAIRCVVQRVDQEKERVILTCKSGFVSSSQGSYNYLYSWMNEKLFISTHYTNQIMTIPSSETVIWKTYPIGSVVSCIVSTSRDYGIILHPKDDKNVTFLALGHSKDTTTTTQSDSNLTRGSNVQARVIGYDFNTDVMKVSLESKLIESATIKMKKSTKSTDSTQVIDIYIESIEDNMYVIGSIHQRKELVTVMVNDYHKPFITTNELKLHTMIKGKLIYMPSIASDKTTSPSAFYHPYTSVPVYRLVLENERVIPKLLNNTIITPTTTTAVTAISAGHNEDGTTSTTTANGEKKKKEKKQPVKRLHKGLVNQWEIVQITPTEIQVKLIDPSNEYHQEGVQLEGILHVTNMLEQRVYTDHLNSLLSQDTAGLIAQYTPKKKYHNLPFNHPFAHMKIGHTLEGQVLHIEAENIEKEDESDTNTHKKIKIFIGIKQLNVNGNSTKTITQYSLKVLQLYSKPMILPGHIYPVTVHEIYPLYCIVAFSPLLTAKLYYMDISSDIKIIKKFKEICYVGQPLIVGVISTTNDGNTKNRHNKYDIKISRTCIESLFQDHDNHSTTTTTTTTTGDMKPLTTFSTLKKTKLKPGKIVYGALDLLASSKMRHPPAFSIHIGINDTPVRLCICEYMDKESWQEFPLSIWRNTNKASNGYNVNRVDNNTSEQEEERQDLTLVDGRKHGDIVKCRILAVDDEGHIDVSLRPSRVKSKDIELSIIDDILPEAGSLIHGYISHISTKTAFIRLSRTLTGVIYLKDLSDDFITNPTQRYPVGKFVQGRLLTCDTSEGTARVSLKATDVDGTRVLDQEISSLIVGHNYEGTVTKITDFGVFVKLHNTNVIGLCRKIHAVDQLTDNLEVLYEVGDVVRTHVLSISTTTKKVGLGLKSIYFKKNRLRDREVEGEDGGGMIDESASEEEYEDEEVEEEELQEDDDENDEVDDDKEEDMNQEEDEGEGDEDMHIVSHNYNSHTDDGPVEDDMVTDEDDIDDNAEDIITNTTATTTPFMWDDFQISSQHSNKQHKKNVITNSNDDDDQDGDVEEEEEDNEGNNDSENDDDDDDDEEDRHRKVKKQKVKEQVYDAENQQTPQKMEDYERLVLSEPNSSYNWIQYISFHVNHFDMDSARVIAERALKTINFREEDEKFNVWIAYLSCEIKFGSKKHFDDVLKRAVAESKGKYIYLKLAEIYESDNNLTDATLMLEKALKKYKYSKKVWSTYQIFHLSHEQIQEAKELLSRSLKSLSRHKHVYVLEKYALKEYDIGAPDRGRLIFENLISSYPNRIDLWHVYVDKEVKMNYIEVARHVYERMITLKTSSHNLKTIFKKYLQFEMKYGTVQLQQNVKQKAKDYVNSIA